MPAVRRTLTAVLLGASLVATTTSSATPVPANRLEVWLVERTVPGAVYQESRVYFVPRDDRGALMIVGFDRRGSYRDLHDGAMTMYVEARGHGAWPAVYHGDADLLPVCPAYELCSNPAAMDSVNEYSVRIPSDPQPVRSSYYVFAYNLGVDIEPSHGWRARRVSGGAFYAIRDQGTGVRANDVLGTTTVEYFDGATAPRTTGPSVAMANMPCPPAPASAVAPGSATLTNQPSDHPGLWRQMSCAYPGASGASDHPTTWRVRMNGPGFSAGWTTAANRLVVAVLPRG